MDPLYAQLRDIRGLDAVPWWPPAHGWWLLLAGFFIFLFLAWRMYRYLTRDWRADARQQLKTLRRRLSSKKDSGKALAGEFSELLRRIAMARYGRDSCAGLQGDPWLAWLKANDPAGFDWNSQARLLLTAPYAPPNQDVESEGLRKLLRAAQVWVDAELPLPPERPRPRYIPQRLWTLLPLRWRVVGARV
jgi:hypothetical protein